MAQRRYYIVLICILASIQFVISVHAFHGYLRSKDSVARELKSYKGSIDEYRLSEIAPFKYRVVFSSIIKSTYHVLFGNGNEEGFYWIYKIWSYIFYVLAPCCLFWLLLNCGYSERLSFVGSLLFQLLPPMLLAFTIPVHTREDTLAYAILFLGIVMMFRKSIIPFLLICVVGVLCRETLLLLPLLYFFFVTDVPWWKRFVIAAVPSLAWLANRFIMGYDNYDVFEGLRWNLHNPAQVIGFLFLTFNVCWIPFLLYVTGHATRINRGTRVKSFIYRSSIYAFVIIVVTTFSGGIFNEIRLLYLFSPWMVVISLDFLKANEVKLKEIASSRSYHLFAGIVVVLFSIGLFFLVKHREQVVVPGRYNIPYTLWIVFAMIYTCITVLLTPILSKGLFIKATPKNETV